MVILNSTLDIAETRDGSEGTTSSLSGREKANVVLLYSPIVVATVLGFIAATIIGRMSMVLAGLGVVAFILGLRHGVDADHIAAIDNTTRKLMQEGKRPLAVGTWFSLGHSTVVVGLIVALILSTRVIYQSIPALQSEGAVFGTVVSGAFLWMMGLVNAVIALGIYGIFKELRMGKAESAQIEELLNKRGFLNRFFKPLFKIVRKSWQIYPIGVLFGLGFDTASEVALIAISVGVGVSGSVPIWTILILPFMFTCGMVIVDTTDGVAMRMAYGWAFLKPIRKIYYNLTVTIISIMVALVIGSVEVLQVLSMEFGLNGWFWSFLNNVNFEQIGYAVVGIFVASWIVSVAYYKYKKIEEIGIVPKSSDQQ